jgi:hypothetical protein
VSIPVVCPECSAKLNAPESAAGQKVKCPKCQSVSVVPAPMPAQPAFEVVDEPEPPATASELARPERGVKRDVYMEDEPEPDRGSRGSGRKRRRSEALVAGVLIAAILAGGFVVYWLGIRDRESPKAFRPREGLPEYAQVESFAVSANGKRAAACGTYPLGRGAHHENNPERTGVGVTVRVWDVEGGSPTHAVEFSRPQVSFGAVALSPDGSVLAACTDTHLVFWDVETGRRISAMHKGRVEVRRPEFTSDGAEVVFASDQSVYTVRVQDGAAVVKNPKDMFNAAGVFARGSGRVAEVRFNREILKPELAVWDPSSEEPAGTVRLDGVGACSQFAVSADGKVVAVCHGAHGPGQRARTTIHTVADGKLIGELPADGHRAFWTYQELALSPDGRFVAGSGSGGWPNQTYRTFDLFRVSDGKLVHRSVAPEDALNTVHHLGFTGDGKVAFCVFHRSRILWVDTESGQEIAR